MQFLHLLNNDNQHEMHWTQTNIWSELYQPHACKQLGLYYDYCNLKPDPITIN